MKTLDTNNFKRNITLFVVALIFALVASINCDAQTRQDTVQVITVQAGKTVLKLTPDDQLYLVSQMSVKEIWMLRFYTSNNIVKNNDCADLIVSIIKNRRK